MKSSMKPKDICRLCPWEEAIGRLEEIGEVDGNCIALVGKICIAIPSELKQRLQSHIGCKISILRTFGLPEKEYLFRVFGSMISSEMENNPKGD